MAFPSRTRRSGALGHLPLPRASALAEYFFQTSASANIFTNNPPTTDRAWKPVCLPVTVSYQSVSGTRLAESLAN